MRTFFLLCWILALLVQTASADVVTYTDADGRVHYVEGADRVPEEFRGTMNLKPKLGAVTKSPSVLYKPVARAKAAASSSQKVEVFVTSWCPYCKKLEAHLQAKGVAYTRYDVERDQKGAGLLRSLGVGSGVPVTRIGSKVISGFDPQEIDRALPH